MMRLNRKGFTLVEVLIVVAILGLLAAIAIPNYIKAREGTAQKACDMNRAVVAKGMRIWATKENKTISELDTMFEVADVTAITDATVKEYFDPADAVCPSDPDTVAYSCKVDPSGLITIYCATHNPYVAPP